MLPRRARVDLGAMAIKGGSVFPKAPALPIPLWMMVMAIVIGTLRMVVRRLGRRLEELENGRLIEIIQPRAFLRSV